MENTLSVSAIEQGTVIDHISAGQAIKIIALFELDKLNSPVTVGLNLPSGQGGTKDLIKLEDRFLSEQEANSLAVFAPNATVNIIEGFQVNRKFKVEVPKSISGVIICPNVACITHSEPIKTSFYLSKHNSHIHARCKYCERTFKDYSI